MLKLLVIVDEAAFVKSFSALQRAEIAEIVGGITVNAAPGSFSALQRAEIAEIVGNNPGFAVEVKAVSVLFNEPKLLKFTNP